jgi:hypothetical protein
MLTLDSHFFVIDGRVRNQFTKEWYFQHHKAGAFVNSAIDPEEMNAKYQCCVGKPSYIQPYKNSSKYDYRCLSSRIYVVATRDIEPGQEILTNYQVLLFFYHLRASYFTYLCAAFIDDEF